MKKYFIPNKQNNHRPHILRKRAVFYILLVVFLVELIVFLQIFLVFPKTKFLATVLPDVLVELTNLDRSSSNLAPLKTNPLLEKAAMLKAQDMAQKGYFSHNSPDGKTPWYWLDIVGYSYTAAGENLAVNFFDSKDIENAWMNSPTHRANILNNKFTEIGIATANGVYQGKQTIFVVQFFGRPAATTNIVSSTKPTSVTSVSGSQKLPSSSTPTKTSPQTTKKQEVAAGNTENTSITQSTQPLREEVFIDIGEQNKVAVVSKPTEEKNLSKPVTVPSLRDSSSILSLFRKISATPRATVNLIYLILGGIILLALLLKIFIKFTIQHPLLILNGVIILLIIASFFYLNYYLFVSRAIVF